MNTRKNHLFYSFYGNFVHDHGKIAQLVIDYIHTNDKNKISKLTKKGWIKYH